MPDFDNIRSIEMQVFETSSKHSRYLACYKDRYFEVTGATAGLIETAKRCSSTEELTTLFSQVRDYEYSQEQIDQLVARCIQPILDSEKKKPRRSLLVKVELISSEAIGRLSRVLKLLFKPPVAVLLAGAIISLEILFFTHTDIHFRIEHVTTPTILGILFLYIASSLFHELGHASACKFFGVDHGGVGFGLYMNFPVFYTDVSNVWKLSRKERVVVNIAGTYFQFIFLIPFILIALQTGNSLVKYFVLTLNLNFLITLNPFFKFDGYWVVSDLLGVPNLRRRTNELFSYLFKRIRGVVVQTKPFLLTMKPTEKIFMLAYSSVVNFFFAYYFCYTMPLFVYRFVESFPPQAKELVESFATGGMPSFNQIRSVVMQLMFMGFTAFFVYRMIKPVIKKIKANKKSTETDSIADTLVDQPAAGSIPVPDKSV